MAIISAGKGVRKQGDSLPVVINGDMTVSQRSESVTGIGDGDTGYHAIDRFKFEEGNSPSAVWTMTQESLSSGAAYNAGFLKALKMDCTTSDDASGHGDILNVLRYGFERQDTHQWKKGTSNAEKFTLAFWIKATKTGTHICELRDSANDRAVSASYTVSSSNTWEKKVVTFPADTTGAIGTGVTRGLSIYWCLYSGSNYQAATLQTAWGSSATNARYTGQVNNADSTSNNWHLTGVQLEVGEYDSTTIPPFQHESYADNELRCSRYFYRIANGSDHGTVSTAIGGGGYFTNENATMVVNLKTNMRVKPSVHQTTGTDYYMIQTVGLNDGFNSFSIGDAGDKVVDIYNNSQISGTAGRYGTFIINNNAALIGLDAEL